MFLNSYDGHIYRHLIMNKILNMYYKHILN